MKAMYHGIWRIINAENSTLLFSNKIFHPGCFKKQWTRIYGEFKHTGDNEISERFCVTAPTVPGSSAAEMSQKRSILLRRNAAVRLRIFIDMSLFVAPVGDSEEVSCSADNTEASLR